jgi:polyhydroxyalkanoate synthesis regulator phasin
MSLKSLFKMGADVLHDARVKDGVAKVLRDPRVMKAVAKGFELKGKVQQEFDQRVEKVAESLNLATKAEVRELKRTIRKLERDLKKGGGDANAS